MALLHLANRIETLAELERAIAEMKALANLAKFNPQDVQLDNPTDIWLHEDILTDGSSVLNLRIDAA